MKNFDQPTEDYLPTECLAQIDELCESFEQELKAGNSPRIEFILNEDKNAGIQSSLLRELLKIERDYARQGGDQIDIGSYRSRFPEHVEIVEEVFSQMLSYADFMARYNKHSLIAEHSTSNLVLGKYVILEKIGQGGMGVVFKAKHAPMDRFVALKLLSPQYTKSEKHIQRFRREVRTVAMLTHPNIAAALDAGQVNDIHLFVMEFVDGKDLSAIVKDHGPMDLDAAISCTMQAARGLECAHQRGVVHRDIKPSNLLLNQEGIVKILDLGLAQVREAMEEDQPVNLTKTGELLGTFNFMAPEQFSDSKTVDARADVYSLGITLAFLLTGKSTYQRDSLSKILEDTQLDRIFAKMVAQSVDERYESMTELINDLQAFNSDAVVAQTPPPTPLTTENSMTAKTTIALPPVDSTPYVPAIRSARRPIHRSWAGLPVDTRYLILGMMVAVLPSLLLAIGLASWQWSRPQTPLVDGKQAESRRAALAVIRSGGTVGITTTGGEDFVRINDVANLPTEFRLRMVDLSQATRSAQLPRYDSGLTGDDLIELHLGDVPDLNTLQLNDNPITDDAVGYLIGLESLQQLHTFGTDISIEGYDRLSAALPKCKLLGRHVDLLAITDPVSSQRFGPAWSKDKEGRLVTSEILGAILEFPYVTPDEYCLLLDVEPLEEPNGLVLGQRMGDSRFHVLINFTRTEPADPWRPGRRAIENLVTNKSRLDASWFAKGKKSQVKITVKNSGVQVTVDEQGILDRKGSPDAISLNSYWKEKLHNNKTLFLGSYSCQYRFHKITLVPISGEGRMLSDTPPVSGWTSLFDGKTFDGWIQKNGTATYRIEDGTIIGTTTEGSPNSFLCTANEYGDFELTFDVKLLTGKLNSGCQIRSQTKEPIQGEKYGRVNGPQVEIEDSGENGAKSGYLYGEAAGGWMTPEEDRKPHKQMQDGRWNSFRILAEGPRIQVWINGNQVSDLTHEEMYKTHPKGFIGLQVHSIEKGSGPCEVAWKNLMIKSND